MYGDGRSYCGTCLEAAKQEEIDRDCEVCPGRMPELSPDNERLFNCFLLCESQVRAGFGGAYALDWSVVVRVADDMGITTNSTFYVLLRAFQGAMLAEIK